MPGALERKTPMSNADLVELYLRKRDDLESDEKRMIIGLLSFAAPIVQAPPPEALSTPAPVAPALVVASAQTVAADGSREGDTVSDETRRRMSEAAKARYAQGGGGGFPKGHKHSAETRRKMSDSAKARIARDNGAHIKKMHDTVRDALARRFDAQVPPMGHPRGWERSDGCEFTSKKRYPNRGAAAADIARLTTKPGPRPIRTYSCPCGGWHTTSQEERLAVQESAR
jgi:hypothetical protein